MTDPTVSAYYSHPGTLLCEHCRAVWKITPSLEGDDLEFMLERYDTHVCDPEVDPTEVEQVRSAARMLAADLPPQPPGGDEPVSSLDGPDDPVLVALLDWHRLIDGRAEALRDMHPSAALLEGANPAACITDREPWEQITMVAAAIASRKARLR